VNGKCRVEGAKAAMQAEVGTNVNSAGKGSRARMVMLTQFDSLIRH
jgi:hypothetical protein